MKNNNEKKDSLDLFYNLHYYKRPDYEVNENYINMANEKSININFQDESVNFFDGYKSVSLFFSEIEAIYQRILEEKAEKEVENK